MKKLLALTFAFAVLIGMIGCEGGTTGAPTNFAIAANTAGDQVVLTWEEPTEGTPDEYVVYFDGDTVATVQALTYTHDPAGATGDYKVAAKLGSDEFDSDVLSTTPIHTVATDLFELNVVGNSGYGWSLTTGAGTTYSMATDVNAASIDFYLSNYLADGTTLPYGIWAPDCEPADPGHTVTTGAWRVTAIGKTLITDPQAILPLHSTTTYAQYCDMASFPAYIAIYTVDGYYALTGVAAAPNAGKVQIETWFQLVKGLRLIAH
jgi:hypothetical protein